MTAITKAMIIAVCCSGIPSTASSAANPSPTPGRPPAPAVCYLRAGGYKCVNVAYSKTKVCLRFFKYSNTIFALRAQYRYATCRVRLPPAKARPKLMLTAVLK
ncbi:MAG: hypothetical protein ACJA13_002415 [Paraglaciecola sp.]|jgi:hypothetical protein